MVYAIVLQKPRDLCLKRCRRRHRAGLPRPSAHSRSYRAPHLSRLSGCRSPDLCSGTSSSSLSIWLGCDGKDSTSSSSASGVGFPLLAFEGLAGMSLLDSPSVGWLLDARLLLPLHLLLHLHGDADWDLALAAALKSFKTSRRCRSRCWRTRTFVRNSQSWKPEAEPSYIYIYKSQTSSPQGQSYVPKPWAGTSDQRRTWR